MWGLFQNDFNFSKLKSFNFRIKKETQTDPGGPSQKCVSGGVFLDTDQIMSGILRCRGWLLFQYFLSVSLLLLGDFCALLMERCCFIHISWILLTLKLKQEPVFSLLLERSYWLWGKSTCWSITALFGDAKEKATGLPKLGLSSRLS